MGDNIISGPLTLAYLHFYNAEVLHKFSATLILLIVFTADMLRVFYTGWYFRNETPNKCYDQRSDYSM